MLPFYIYYSIFGFQRVGDLIWAAADSRARGFLVGGTAGRTTLAGEGLQHQDGSSHLAASTIPNCRAYDPCFGYELAAIVEDGARRMLEAQEARRCQSYELGGALPRADQRPHRCSERLCECGGRSHPALCATPLRRAWHRRLRAQ